MSKARNRKLEDLWPWEYWPTKFRDPIVLNDLVMMGAGLFVYFLIMASFGNDMGALVLVGLAVAGAFFRWPTAPALFLILTTYLLIDPNMIGLVSMLADGQFRPSRGPRGRGFSLEDLLLSMSILAYVIGQYRLLSFLRQGMPSDPNPRSQYDDVPEKLCRPLTLASPSEIVKVLGIAVGALMLGQVGWIFLRIIADNQTQSPPYAFSRESTRTMLFLWVLVLSVAMVRAGVGYLRLLRMSHQAARVVLQDTFFAETRRETDRIQRWKMWYREYQASKAYKKRKKRK